MIVAALDLGTNTFLCLIAEVNGGKIKKILWDGARVVRLGQEVDKTRKIHPEAMLRSEACFAWFREKITEYGVEKTIAVATSAARDAENSEDFSALAKKFAINIQLASGDEEAELTYLGATSGINTNGCAVVDVGGGSTEIIIPFENALKGKSMNIGSVRLTEKFISGHPVIENEMRAMCKEIADVVSQTIAELGVGEFAGEVLAVAGTPTTIAAMNLQTEFEADKIDGYKLSESSLLSWRNKLVKMSVEERSKITGLSAGRADVIVAGICILIETLKCFGKSELTVSTRGVRYGLALRSERC